MWDKIEPDWDDVAIKENRSSEEAQEATETALVQESVLQLDDLRPAKQFVHKLNGDVVMILKITGWGVEYRKHFPTVVFEGNKSYEVQEFIKPIHVFTKMYKPL